MDGAAVVMPTSTETADANDFHLPRIEPPPAANQQH
jgi:hypothetical protein